ncbi:MAG: thioesterase family protein [Dehalococcoidia bacterium]
MARIKLDLPDSLPFSTEIPIRISDINYGGHLGHDAILPIAHEARIHFLASMGYNEGDIEGLTYIMSDAAIVYKSQAFHGQTLTVEVGVQDFGRTSCDFVYRLRDRETGVEIARARTGMVFFDYRAGKSVEVPPEFRERFSE